MDQKLTEICEKLSRDLLPGMCNRLFKVVAYPDGLEVWVRVFNTTRTSTVGEAISTHVKRVETEWRQTHKDLYITPAFKDRRITKKYFPSFWDGKD